MDKAIINIKKEKGITLVALVVTIIVLLILAFIGISILMGDNGVINKAGESKDATIRAQEREYIKLSYQKLEVEKSTKGFNITADKLAAELKNYDEKTSVNQTEASEIGDKEIVIKKEFATDYAEVTYQETGHKYIVSFEIDTTKIRHTITFDANGGYGGPTIQEKIEGEDLIITTETPEKKWNAFAGWSEDSSATTAQYKGGDRYAKEENATLYAVWTPSWKEEDAVAQIGNTKYITIQEAVEVCSKEAGDTQTTIIILKNTEEQFTIYEGQNIILDLKGHTVISESTGVLCTNNGRIQIINGELRNNKGTTILNNGEITIGDDSTGINSEVPTIYGYNMGIENNGTFNFYDGKIQGIVPIKGNVTKTPDQYGPVSTSMEGNITTVQLGIVNIYEARIGWVYYTALQEAIDVAKSKETVTIIKDIQLKETAEVSAEKDITLDLYGYTLSIVADKNTIINNSGILEIIDSSTDNLGKIEIKTSKVGNNSSRMYTSGIRNENNGKLTLSSGTIYSTSEYYYACGIYNSSSENVTINGGEIKVIGNYDIYGIYNVGSGLIKITEGTINCKTEKQYSDIIYGIYNKNNGIIEFSGGNLICNSAYDKAYGIFNINGIVSITNGIITINVKSNLLGGNSFGVYNNSSGKVNISDGKIDCNSTDVSYGLYNNGSGIIEIKGGIINSYNSKYGYGIYNKNDGNVILTNGNVNSFNNISYNYGIFNSGLGTIKINGGIINSYDNVNNSKAYSFGIYNTSEGNIIIGAEEEILSQLDPLILGATMYQKGVGLYNVLGNVEFYNGTIQGNIALSGILIKTRENCKIEKEKTEEKETLFLVNNINTEYIAQVGENKYYTLEEAITSINTDEISTIQILNDFELNEEVYFNKKIILNLNGHTICNNFYKIENSGELTIIDTSENKDGKIVCTNTITGIINNGEGNITLEECTINLIDNSVNSKNYCFYNNSNGIIKVSNGNVVNTSSNDYGYGIYNVNSGKIEVKNGTITSNKFGIYNASDGTIEISGGIVKGILYGIYNESKGNIKLEQGEINSDRYGIYGGLNSGSIEVTGGKIISKSYGIYNYKNIVTMTGGEINSNGCGIFNYYSPGTINISGGSVNAGTYGIYIETSGSIVIGIKGDEEVSKVNPSIIGKKYGIYNTNGKLYFYDGILQGGTKAVYDTITEIEENTELDYNDDETILKLSTEPIPIAQIGEIKYTDLQEAVNSVGENQETIKIIKNITYTSNNDFITIPESKDVILDLNGYKVISTIQEKLIKNDGKLKIIDSNTDKKGNMISNTAKTVYNSENAELTILETTIENRVECSVYNEGKLNIENAKITTIGRTNNYGIYNTGNGVVNINGGKISGTSDRYTCAIYNDGNGKILLKNGTVSASSYYISSSKIYGIYNSGTGDITIENGTINSSAYGICNINSGNVFMENGTINTSGQYENYGIYNNTGTIMIKGGNIDSKSLQRSCYGIYNNKTGNVIIGNQDDNTISQDTPIIKASKWNSDSNLMKYGIYNLGKLYIYDGQIKGFTKGIYGSISGLAESTELKISEEIISEQKCEVITLEEVTTNVASIKDIEYDSIQKAIEACGETENTITILRDCNPGITSIIKDNQNITIDLNGHTINNYIELQNKGNLKIIDTSAEQTGKIVGLTGVAVSNSGTMELQSGTIADSGYGIKNTGILNITGGKLINNNYGIYNSGTSNITDGVITSNKYGLYNYSNTINISSGIITSNEYGIYNSSGTTNITSTGINNNTYGSFNAGGTTNIKEGSEIQSNIGVYVSGGTLNIGESGTMNSSTPLITGETYGLSVSETAKVYMYDGQIKGKTGATQGFITYTESGYVVANRQDEEYFVDYLALEGTIGSVAEINGINYSSLQSAINSIAGEETQTIKLTNGIDTDVTFTISEGQNIILDMNEKTITSSANITIQNAGNLTVIDSTESGVAKISSTTGTAVVNSGTLTLGQDDGTVSQDIITIEGATYGIENIGTLNFYDGTINGDSAVNGTVTNSPSGYNIQTTTVNNKERYYLST